MHGEVGSSGRVCLIWCLEVLEVRQDVRGLIGENSERDVRIIKGLESKITEGIVI